MDERNYNESQNGTEYNLEILKKSLLLTNKEMKIIMDKMTNAYNNGLNKKESSVKMLNTYVHKLPNRNQNCISYGIDLGGSNLRVLRIKFVNGKMTKYVQHSSISDKILHGTATQLFDLIAETLEKCARHFSNDKIINLGTIGFTFSFPVNQHSLTSGTLIQWTKGFNVKNAENHDVSKLLMKSIKKRSGICANAIALINDTVGTLLCGGQIHENVQIGFILGTGMNAAYIEKSKNVKDLNCTEENVIINTEFGGFGSLGELDMFQKSFDIKVDQMSLRPGKQILEKFASGLYMSKISNEILRENNINLQLSTSDIADFVDKNYDKISQNLKIDINSKLFNFLKKLSFYLSTRSAMFASLGLSSLIQKIDQTNIVISADGSVIQYNHFLRNKILYYIKKIVPNKNVSIVLVKDGSGTGAAILASTL